jgi:LysR family transcriptional activator of nhaA
MAGNINYQHLYYFWNVIKEESFTKASKKLGLAQPTVSGQISTFEKTVGAQLISRQGKKIFLTETGRIVFNYADKIFSLGDKMNDDIKNSRYHHCNTLTIGHRNSMPGCITANVSNFIHNRFEDYRVTCIMDNNHSILNDLSRNFLDIVITDEPFSYLNGVSLFSHLLFESEISLLCQSQYTDRFSNFHPDIIEKYPCILPTHNTRMRRLLDDWIMGQQIKSLVIAEVESFDVMINMAKSSCLLMFAPTIILKDIREQIDFLEIYRITKPRIKYYMTTLTKNPEKDIINNIIKNTQLIFF